jgi:N,N'-diacetyllegionaminate synthase|tara:strand:+ start:1296 stop:2312 length:1017 start_codon:yes stop_codon:yes gene_type:complete
MNINLIKKPYIIAEIGINHEGNFSTAKKLIFEAKKAGANAVKFQVFKPETLAIKKSKKTKFQKKTSGKEELSTIWNRVCLSYTILKKLKDYSKKLKIDFICTPFDFESLNLVKKLNLNAIKIASSDMTDYPLISEISKLKKPIILSTGMSSSLEISKTLKVINSKNVTILHCVSMYPCDNKKANLSRILSLKKKFREYTVGYSDHCKNFEASIYALSLGAKVIEKHFTLDKKRVGLDHSLSADPIDLKIICDYANSINDLPGKNQINPSPHEKKFTKFFRKGIYANKVLSKNQVIKRKDLIIRRPENKCKPDMYWKLIGKRVKKKINLHDPINFKEIY